MSTDLYINTEAVDICDINITTAPSNLNTSKHPSNIYIYRERERVEHDNCYLSVVKGSDCVFHAGWVCHV